MSHDKRDPQELTPADGRRASLGPPPEPLTAHEQQQLRVDYALLLGEVRKLRRLWINDDDTMVCPFAGAKCAALDMAETATIGVAEIVRSRHILSAVIGACALLLAAAMGTGGTLLINRASAVAREQAEAVTMRLIRDSQKSTEEISREGGKVGAQEFWKELQRSQQVAPIKR